MSVSQPHLANVPTYLKPDTENATASVASVGASKRAHAIGKRRAIFSKGGKKRSDPLHSFRGGGKGGGKGGKGGRGGGKGR